MSATDLVGEVGEDDPDGVWKLRLYVAGESPNSLQALTNLTALCEANLMGRYEIEVIDLAEDPDLAQSDDILAVPTLVRRLPEPMRKIIGDLSRTESVLLGLRLESEVPNVRSAGLAATLFDGAVPSEGEVFYELTLFVSGASDLAARAIANARQLCEIHLDGRFHLSVVDVHEDPASLRANNLLATPTLVRSLPAPIRRVVGDLSQTEKVVTKLDLPAAPTTPPGLG